MTSVLPTQEAQDEYVPYAGHVGTAGQQFEAAQAKLYRSDGQPIYGPEEHEARKEALLTAFDDAIAGPIAIQERQLTEAETALQAVQREPYERLDSPDLARAADLLQFAKEDFEALPLESLLDRCRAAQAGGRKAEMVLAARYGRLRVQREHALHPATQHTGEGVALQGGHPEAVQLAALGGALRALDEALSPADAPKKAAAALQARKELNALRRLAGATRRNLDGTKARDERAMRARFGI